MFSWIHTKFTHTNFSFEGNARSQGAGGAPRGAPRRGRGAAAASTKRYKRPVPTAEQLDAELDAYVKEIKWKQLVQTSDRDTKYEVKCKTTSNTIVVNFPNF